MIKWGQKSKPQKIPGPKFNPQKSHAKFLSHKNFQKAINDITTNHQTVLNTPQKSLLKFPPAQILQSSLSLEIWSTPWGKEEGKYVPRLNFKTYRFAYWGGPLAHVGILLLYFCLPSSKFQSILCGLSRFHLPYQGAKKVVSDSPGLVDFAIGLVNSVFNLPDGQVMFYEEFE